MELDLLEYFGVAPDDRELSQLEKDAIGRRRKQQFNEFQFRAHVEQEERQRQRAEQNLSGRAARFTHQEREHRHHYGNFWFAGGNVPPSHNVGKSAAPSSRVIVHPMNSDENPLTKAPHSNTWQDTSGHSYEEAMEADEPPKKIVIHPKVPPPRVLSCVAPPDPRSERRRVPDPVPSPISTAVGRSPGMQTTTPRQVRARDRQDPLDPPFAVDIPKGEELYDVPAPLNSFRLGGFQFDRNGVPRGRNGIDFEERQAREAQQLAEDMRQRANLTAKKQQQELLKAQLDELVEIKRRQRAVERELDDRSVYGYSLPGLYEDPRRKDARKAASRALEQEWLAQAQAVKERKAAEDDFYKPYEEDWNELERKKELRQQAAEMVGSSPGNPQHAWLQAWQEHDAREAEIRALAKREREQQSALEIHPNVLNYSSRILQGEQLRKKEQKEYARQLDEQVRQRQYMKQRRTVENYARDARFSRPPFVPLPHAWSTLQPQH